MSKDTLATKCGDCLTSTSDRRQEQRLEPPRMIAIYVDNLGIHVDLVDYSARGIGFLSSVPMVAGDAFILHPKKGDVVLLVYRVKNCRQAACGRYRIGAELVCCNLAEATAEQILTGLQSL